MIGNPGSAPNGTRRAPNNAALPQLNPEIARWLQDRHGRLKEVHTTATSSWQTLNWIPIKSQFLLRSTGTVAAGPKRQYDGLLDLAELRGSYLETFSDHSLMRCGRQNYDNPPTQ
jgi:hypothetical protein